MRLRQLLTALGICLMALAAGLFGPGARPVEATGAVALAAGGAHTCALATAGGLQCWGLNDSGQVGDGTFSNSRVTPVDVVGLQTDVAAVSSGERHTCALTAEGGIKCWGDNTKGKLGDGTQVWHFTPIDVPGLESGMAAVSAGQFHTCALTITGGVKCWGSDASGQLGSGGGCPFLPPFCATPVDVAGLSSGVAAVSVGGRHSCALTITGSVKCWGSNAIGQLGNGTITDSATPVDVMGLGSGVASVSAGLFHTCAVTTAGGVKCWGLNYSGQLGNGTTGQGNFSVTPVDVQGLGTTVTAVASGGYHTCALTSVGGVSCWGDNSVGQLGAATDEWCPPGSGIEGPPVPCSSTPVAVRGLGSGVEAVAAGYEHTCALLVGGSAKCWGRNFAGALGNGTTTDSPVPVDVLFDSDKDGCADVREQGADASRGGLRNPKSFWDFFDTPDAANVRDKAVGVSDIFRIVARFGTTGDPAIDPLSAPSAAPAYHTAFDRTLAGPNPWNTGPPNGSVAIEDIALVVAQFGHTCA